ncbi:MAG: hypothetical protein R3D89_09930 [Sphingomonadaceae bacterium]
MKRFAPLAAALLLAACQGGGNANVPGDSEDKRPFAMIAEDETLQFSGTEPFWGGTVSGGTLTWSTPENIEGTTITVERFAGRGGLSFSGELEGRVFDMMVTPGDCSDGMSDRTYPFVVTVQLDKETRKGCAHSDRHPFEGPQNP